MVPQASRARSQPGCTSDCKLFVKSIGPRICKLSKNSHFRDPAWLISSILRVPCQVDCVFAESNPEPEQFPCILKADQKGLVILSKAKNLCVFLPRADCIYPSLRSG